MFVFLRAFILQELFIQSHQHDWIDLSSNCINHDLLRNYKKYFDCKNEGWLCSFEPLDCMSCLYNSSNFHKLVKSKIQLILYECIHFHFFRNYHSNDFKIVIEAKMRFVVLLSKILFFFATFRNFLMGIFESHNEIIFFLINTSM